MTSDLREIRARHTSGRTGELVRDRDCEQCALLAHIDALTAKVEALPRPYIPGRVDRPFIDRAAVLAILRGEA